MPLQELLLALGEEIQDPGVETFLLFSQPLPSQNLGFIDAKAKELDVSVAGRDLSITQSPGLLSSNRKGGTTGAVAWKITPLFAEWMASDHNMLFKTAVLDQKSQVLELGCGVSGINAVALSPRVGGFIATDQDYVFKLLRSNLEANALKQKASSKTKHYAPMLGKNNIDIVALDWESNSVTNLSMVVGEVARSEPSTALNAILACDCIYNEALIRPFVQTCVDLCELHKTAHTENPTVCIIAEQLRSDSVFEAWLSAFHKAFRVWRVPDELLPAGLRQGSGFVIHIGILREGTGWVGPECVSTSSTASGSSSETCHVCSY